MLEKFLENSKKVIVIGVGDELRGDDAVGSVIARELKAANVIDAGSVPENFVGIAKESPSHIIIVDAIHFCDTPGKIGYFENVKILGEEISSHKLPLRLFIDYVKSNCSCRILLIGIEPKNLGFNSSMSKEVLIAKERVISELKSALSR